MLTIDHAQTLEQIDTVRTLMREYQRELGVDLSFQGFEHELERLPGAYAQPAGRLLFATYSDEVVGCVALHGIDTERCEMKRLYVRPAARGLGVGKAMIARVLEEARAIGYQRILLDTLPKLTDAQRLYELFGFVETSAYRPNPIHGVRYLVKVL